MLPKTSWHVTSGAVQENPGWKAVGVCLDDFFQRWPIEDLFLKGARVGVLKSKK